MGVAVVFDYSAWVAAFPQFATNPGQTNVVNVVLPIAEIYCRNDGGGPVSTAATQTTLLNLMVAHVCQLLYGPNGNNPGGIVGRVTNAAEGSVNVATEFPASQAAAWYLQTQFGATFWGATAPYRTMRYRPGPRRINNPWMFQ
jgi:hypothetical protein